MSRSLRNQILIIRDMIRAKGYCVELDVMLEEINDDLITRKKELEYELSKINEGLELVELVKKEMKGDK